MEKQHENCLNTPKILDLKQGVGYKSMEQTLLENAVVVGHLWMLNNAICGEWEDPDNLLEDICERCFEEKAL